MKLKKELPLLLIIAIPLVYLAYVWNSLPETVPLHWNFKGEIDNWGDKSTLIWTTCLFTIFMYGLLSIIPFIDPKKKLQNMGQKYYNLKFFLLLFMSGIAVFIIYSVKEQAMHNPNLLFIVLGLLFVVLGNYMKTIKANYFIGIRTPWTLENETVWKKTHQLGGKLWFVGGLLIVICCLIFKKELSSKIFIGIVITMSLIPVLYSYVTFKKLDS
ncbi:SdpI family protein [Gaetbulibacter aestuarii]|uniref:SdpI family protein n=1 Tax=Gaetbulibacter aestuarii TaxID=1502358 RepID=A0ABW7MWI8_9FLAO